MGRNSSISITSSVGANSACATASSGWASMHVIALSPSLEICLVTMGMSPERIFCWAGEPLSAFWCLCSSSLLCTRVFVLVQLVCVCHVLSAVVAAVEDSVVVLVFCFSVAPIQPWALLADLLVGFVWLRT
jgi:hypothetical protein